MDGIDVRFVIGVLLAVMAAAMMLLGPGTVSAPIAVLVLGIVLIATSRRGRSA